jgi:nucleoside-diphosphate-sugar epimerase
MKALLLGGAGYVGRVLTAALREAGHEPTVFDLFNFSQPADLTGTAAVRIGDTRELAANDFADVDVVLDLAAISNDPSGELNPALTREINSEARSRAAGLARRMGVPRYLLFSSCSVYGANEHIVDEASPLNPLTEYAVSNARAERDIFELENGDFCVTALRLATVFGISPSMRFDLVVNTMTLSVFETGRIKVTGGGNQYRPLVHVADIAAAVEAVLASPPAVVSGQIFNIGHANMRMRDVAAAVVRGINRPIDVIVDDNEIDKRNYRVNTDKARERLGFVAEHTVADGAAAIFDALESGALKKLPSMIRLNGYRDMVARLVS